MESRDPEIWERFELQYNPGIPTIIRHLKASRESYGMLCIFFLLSTNLAIIQKSVMALLLRCLRSEGTPIHNNYQPLTCHPETN
jgi:hypothetical protein